MIKAIFYALIAIGVGVFVFLIRRKWPQLQKEETPQIKLDKNFFKHLGEKNLQFIKYLFLNLPKRLIKGLKNIKPKSIRHLFSWLKLCPNSLKRLIKKTKDILKPIKLIEKAKNKLKTGKPSTEASMAKISFEEKALEQKEEGDKKKETRKIITSGLLEKNKEFFTNLKKNLIILIQKIEIQKRSKNLSESIRRKIKRINWKVLTSFIQELRKRVKTKIRSEEDVAIKEKLQKKQTPSPIKEDSYLGDLLKKAKPFRTGDSFTTNKKEVSLEDKTTEKASFQEKSSQELKQARTAPQQETIAKKEMPQIKDEALPRQSPQFSQETIKKMEEKFIDEISRDPKNIEAYKKLGKFYYNQDRFDYAKECFEAALKLGSGDQKIKDLFNDCQARLTKR